MCGIFGVCGKAKKDEQIRMLEAGLKGVEARGPFGTDIHVEDGLALGHAHLPLVAVGNQAKSRENRQPLVRGSNVITYNGEIYDWKEQNKRLGIQPTAGDTETMLRGLEREGIDFLGKIDANYGFLASINNEYLAARDRHGLFPLYYAEERGKIGFASKFQALRATGFSPENLRIVPPGCYVKVKGGKAELSSWSKPEEFIPIEEREPIDPREFREVIEEAAKSRLPDTNPDGRTPMTLALGGKDSATLSYLVSRELGNSFLGCVTVVPENDREGGDLPGARATLAKYSRETGITIPHFVLPLTREYAESRIDELLDLLGPSYPNLACALPEDLFARHSRAIGAKVVMTAGGPDEGLVGYPWVFMFTDREKNTDSLITQIGENEFLRNTLVLGDHGVENRAPYERILDLSRTIPEWQKYSENPDGTYNTKLLLKQAIRGLIPEEVVDAIKMPVRSATGGGTVLEKIMCSDREYQTNKGVWERDLMASDWALLMHGGSKGGFMGEGALYTMWRWASRNSELFDLGAQHFYGNQYTGEKPHPRSDVYSRSRQIFASNCIAYGIIDQSQRKI